MYLLLVITVQSFKMYTSLYSRAIIHSFSLKINTLRCLTPALFNSILNCEVLNR